MSEKVLPTLKTLFCDSINVMRTTSFLTAVLSCALLAATCCEASPNEQKKVCRIFSAEDGFDECPNPLWKENTFDTYDLNTGAKYKTYFDTGYSAARLDPGETSTPIHAFDKCYFVDNMSNNSFFVPFSTDEEWTAFINNHPKNVILRKCSMRAIYISKSATSKNDRAVFSLPNYAHEGETATLNSIFGYFSPKKCETAEKCTEAYEWTETITVRFMAKDPTWSVVGESVSASEPKFVSE